MNKVSPISAAMTPSERRMRMLRTAMGPAIAAALDRVRWYAVVPQRMYFVDN